MQVVPEGLPIYSVVEQSDSDRARRVGHHGLSHPLHLGFVCVRPLQESAVPPYYCLPAAAKDIRPRIVTPRDACQQAKAGSQTHSEL